MKRLFHLAFALFLLATVTSCSSDFDEADRTPQSDEPIAHTVSHYVTADEALQTVMEFFSLDETRAALPEVKSHSIYRPNTTTRSADLEYEVMFHVFNFEDNGGYAIVSADDRTTDIYAYSETGNIDMDEALDNPGFNIFMNNAAIYFEEEIEASTSGLNPPGNDNIPEFPFKPNPGTGGGGGGGGGEDDVTKYMITNLDGTNYYTKSTGWVTVEEVSPLITTKWHQDYPYNYFCPRTSNPVDSITLAGCVPVAIAQIMAYHEKPTRIDIYEFDWDAIKSKDCTDILDNTSVFAAKLIRQIGDDANTDYGVTGSSTSSSKAKAVFQSYGYNADGLKDYDEDKVISSLNYSRPVYVRGDDTVGSNSGHAWVIDGYQKKNNTSKYYSMTSPYNLYRTITETKIYIHCNMGWMGREPLYCLSNVFIIWDYTPRIVKSHEYINTQTITNIYHE